MLLGVYVSVCVLLGACVLLGVYVSGCVLLGACVLLGVCACIKSVHTVRA